MEQIQTSYLKLLEEVASLKAGRGADSEWAARPPAPSASEIERLKQELDESSRKARRLDEALEERDRAKANGGGPSVEAAAMLGLLLRRQPARAIPQAGQGSRAGDFAEVPKSKQARPLQNSWRARPAKSKGTTFTGLSTIRFRSFTTKSGRIPRPCWRECRHAPVCPRGNYQRVTGSSRRRLSTERVVLRSTTAQVRAIQQFALPRC
ncbi:uncharacterized protein A4U43_C07F690 [Asparagus officinalis]|uniref:Uncharacterized protein n=1 Tax=Asparagus officinalis TaxID=4686 RepID=A0A5P1E8S1_ASPOF|nr:uncharacterized protein A4U43_C07F690 [Asparagus officinalis]